MKKLSPGLLYQIYLPLVLLTAFILSPPPYSLLAIGWLLVILFLTLRLPQARFKLAVTVATFFIVPLVLTPTIAHLALQPAMVEPIISTAFILPVIYQLDHNLRQNARQITIASGGKSGWRCTDTYRAIFTTMLVTLIAALILNNLTLLFADIILVLYLAGVTTGALFTIPRLPLNAAAITRRVIAGTHLDIAIEIISKASTKIHCFITPLDPWIQVTSDRLLLNKGKTNLNLYITPPLAGPVNPQLGISVMDSRGLIKVNQIIEPLALHVIPRAKYAEWLAMKYLEQKGTGVTSAAALPPKTFMIPNRGIEYFDSRTYQAGDQLKDIDWKHTLKLSQLIVREYIEGGERSAIIAANLSVTDAEEADKLAFNIITIALTLAREHIPAALAAYNHQGVVLTTASTEPREILKLTLPLIKEITTTEFPHRHLELPDIARLRRNITHLKRAKSEPAQRLLGMLDFEYRAIEKAAKDHPATTALSTVTDSVPAPAMILIISQLNHDAEALMVTTEKLARRKFTTISLPANTL